MTASTLARLYGIALRLYPPSFRKRFGDEMAEFARERLLAVDEAEAQVSRLFLALIFDVVRSAPGEWYRAGRNRAGSRRDGSAHSYLPPRDNMDIVIQDLKFAARSLMRRPGFTIVAAITLALGIGANTAIFSVVNAVLVRALPYDNPDQLTIVWGTQGQQRGQGVVYLDYLDWRARNRTFTDLGAFRGQSVNLTGGDTPERLIGSFVTSSFLRVIGAKMSQGRAFTDVETDVATKAPVAVLSFECWQARFGGDPAMVGKTIVIDGTTFTVIGVFAPKTQVPL
ncbi:MAG: ABC transporter permease, partial [Gemmatimonadaceae bacterium]